MSLPEVQKSADLLARYSDLLPAAPVRDEYLEAAIDHARERLGAARARRRDGTPVAQLTLEA